LIGGRARKLKQHGQQGGRAAGAAGQQGGRAAGRQGGRAAGRQGGRAAGRNNTFNQVEKRKKRRERPHKIQAEHSPGARARPKSDP